MINARRAEDFVQLVAELEFNDVFNPYSDVCPKFDHPHAAQIRRRNLEAVVEAALDQQVRSIWIARDLGYRGGRRTGLALTDEAHLSEHAKILGIPALAKSTTGPTVSERTARVIWDMLLRINEPVFLWNIFPLHPHGAHEPMSNRCHTRSERLACRHVLDALMDLIKPDFILAIGRDAKLALDELEIESNAVRHPSYGGQSEFINGVSVSYGLQSMTPQHSFSF